MAEFPYKAHRRVKALIESLTIAVERDGEQEVQGMALPVLLAALQDIGAALGDDPVVAAIDWLISPEAVEAGEPIRAIDALLVAKQLSAAIGRPPIVVA